MSVHPEGSSAVVVMMRNMCLSATVLVLDLIVNTVAEIARLQGGTQI